MKVRKYAAILIVVFAIALLFQGCAAYSISPVTGFIYTDVKAPLTATNSTEYSKTGTSRATSILGLVATGDASIEAAMKDGNITQVHHVDFYSKSILGIYAEFIVTVYGE